MGSSNGITRGQLRPHFSGRSPPFVLAALCVGLGILGVSYWSLSQQYNQLEDQLKKTLIRKDSIESDLNLIHNQLSAREVEFSRAQQNLQKSEQQLSAANTDLKTKSDEYRALQTQLDSLQDSNTKCNEELSKKTSELGDAVIKLNELKDIEQQQQQQQQTQDSKPLNELQERNKQLETELEYLKKQLISSNRNNSVNPMIPMNSVSSINSANVVQKPNIETNALNISLVKSEAEVNKGEEEAQPLVPKPIEDLNEKAVIAEPLKPNQVVATNVLEEEDRKEEALVEANNNEIADEMKAEANKEGEEFKNKPQI